MEKWQGEATVCSFVFAYDSFAVCTLCLKYNNKWAYEKKFKTFKRELIWTMQVENLNSSYLCQIQVNKQIFLPYYKPL